MSSDDGKRGWYEKYNVTKANGNPVDPEAIYFVLRIDKDSAAQVALLAYMLAIKQTNPTLADDISCKLLPILTGSMIEAQIEKVIASLVAENTSSAPRVNPV